MSQVYTIRINARQAHLIRTAIGKQLDAEGRPVNLVNDSDLGELYVLETMFEQESGNYLTPDCVNDLSEDYTT